MPCYDCGREYGDEHGFPDLVVPIDVWRRISPAGDEGGLLCPSCICKRLYDAGIQCEGAFMSGPIESVQRTARSANAHKQIAYVDGVDLQHHLDGDASGVVIFGDADDLRKASPCVEECGIAEIEITIKRWVLPQSQFTKPKDAPDE